MAGFSRRSAINLGLLASAASLVAPGRPLADVPLAIKGYDAVAYFTIGKPTPGLPDIAHEWDEQRYLFATSQHRDLFKSDPVRYAPQFANYCAVALARGELDEANPEYWLISDGKLYLFGKPVGPSLWQDNLKQNVVQAEQNRSMIIKR